MKKYLIGLYIVGAFLTNSYVRQYRLDEWNKADIKELSNYTPVYQRDVKQQRIENNVACIFTTVLWPVYVVSRLSDLVVRIDVKVEAPDVLKAQ